VSGQARLRTISVRGTEEAANITSIADIALTEDEAPVLEIVGFGHRGFEEIVQSLGGLNSRLDTPFSEEPLALVYPTTEIFCDCRPIVAHASRLTVE